MKFPWQLAGLLFLLGIVVQVVKRLVGGEKGIRRRRERRDVPLPPMPDDSPVTRDGLEPEVWPVVARRLLTPIETKLFTTLCEALPGHRIMSQVAVSRIVDVKPGSDGYYWFNRFSRMTVDFVVCDQAFNVIAAIELDDPSHGTARAEERDGRKDKALASAGIRLYRWRTNSMPNIHAIRKAIGAIGI